MLSFCRFALVLLLSQAIAGAACAAELGEPVVRSHIGQPLVADVELTLLADPGTAVGVRMAHADVYKGANIAIPPVLSSVNMSVMKRDGRQFLHITSIRPVNAEYLHLFLELTEGGKRNVRTVTLWLTPDPTPAPPPAPVPPPVAAPAPAAVAPAPLAAPRPVRVLTLPPAPAAVCPQPKFSAEQIQACEAMDQKNAQLSAQIVDLEAKVRVLQLAIEGKGTAAASASASAKPVPAPPPPKKAVKQEAGFPWLAVIGGVLLLLAAAGAGVWYFLKRRKAGTAPEAPPTDAGPPWHKRLLAKLKRAPEAAPAPAPAPEAAAAS